jgi:hypothetical protein
MSEPEDEQFLSRWSRRKRATRRPDAKEPQSDETREAPEGAQGTERDAEADAAREAELRANREAAEAVDLETLNEDSDFSVFMKEGVPHLLRRRAMAALWRSSPVFANLDRLVDYDDDFGSPDLVAKTLQSAWQVGRGYLKDAPGGKAAPDEAASESDAPAPVDAADDPALPEPAGETGAAASAEEAAHSPATEPEPVAKAKVDTPIPDEETGEVQDAEQPMPRVSLRRRLMLNSGS